MVNMEKDFKISPSIVYLAWAAATFFYFYQYIFRIMPGIMADEIRVDLRLNADEFSWFCSLYLYAYALMQIPLGLMLDRYGIRKILVWSVALCIAGGGITSCIHDVYIAYLGRFLTGAGAGAAFLSSMKIVADFVPEGRRGGLIGATLTIGIMPAMMLSHPLAEMNNFFGWDSTYSYVSILGVIVLASVIVLIHDFTYVKNYAKKEKSVFGIIRQVGSSKYLICYSIVAVGLFLPLSVLADLWGVSFLKMKFSMSTADAASVNSYLYLGAAIGSLLLPWYFEKINRIDFGIKISFFAIAILYTTLLYCDNYREEYLRANLFGVGFFCGAVMLCFTGAARYFSSEHSGIALGLLNTLNMLGGAILQNIVGRILDHNWQGMELEENIRSYNSEEYIWALSSVIVVMIIGMMLSLVILKDKKIKKKLN